MASETFRYDDMTGTLWLNEEFAINLVYDYSSRVWAVGASANNKFVEETAALAAAQRILRAAASEQDSHVRIARDNMDAALQAAGIPTGVTAT